MGARIRRACPGVKTILQNLQNLANNLPKDARFLAQISRNIAKFALF
jgi:hypothetical protein